ncbi:hypothetical protein SDC9_206409 [bioreactor metagenome]|uniref:Uncharacterized protein n=1 Tax=bioreactor metagenome TaxID=1076179 RepID=A0A645J4Y7_9ZZZZ
MGIKLVEIERPVIIGARKPEAVFNQAGFPGEIAAEHTAYLGQRHMRLVDK